MGRASFGGVQNLDAAFASFYRDYQNELDTLTNRAASRAREEQQAADSDAIDKWQSGEMSDAKFLAYAQQRVDESKGEEPQDAAYWKKVLRDARKQILTQEISDGAQDILDDIDAGKKTWQDLLHFYNGYRRDLTKNDPLRDDLDKQINDVHDRVEQNKVEGRFAQIQYQFQAGRISGATAAAEIRGLAQRYKVNDPQRYYQMLGQALDLARYGGFSGSGGGGRSSGGGSGGGSGYSSPLDAIDQVKIREDQILSLSDQFEKGVKVGEITTVDGKGHVHTEEIQLANPDGSPSESMKQLDHVMIENYDRGIALLTRSGSTEAGTWIKAKSSYITDHIQPRNTVIPDKQAQAMLSTGISLAEHAANSDDPVAAWGQVQAWAKDVQKWEAKLNVNVKHYSLSTKEKQTLAELTPDLTDQQRTTSQSAKDLQHRTTEDFAGQAGALRDFALALANGDEAAMRQALAGFDTTETTDKLQQIITGGATSNPVVDRLAVAMDLVKGIPEGRYARVIVPGQGLVYAPVQTTYATVVGADGRPQTVPQAIPVNPSTGQPLANEKAGEQLVDVMVQVGGQVQMVKAVAQPAYFVDGKPISASDYQSALKQYNEADNKDGLSQPVAYQQVLIPGAGGQQGEVWLFDQGRDLWFRNKVTKYGGVPLIFHGGNAQLAQSAAAKLGVDPSGKSYYNAPAVNAFRAGKLAQDQNDDWYRAAYGTSKREVEAGRRAEFAQSLQRLNPGAREALGADVRAGASLLGDTPILGNFLSNSLLALGQQLGIRTHLDDQQSQTSLARRPTLDERNLNLPKIGRQLPKIDIPEIANPLPSISEDRATVRRRRRRLAAGGSDYTDSGKANNLLGLL